MSIRWADGWCVASRVLSRIKNIAVVELGTNKKWPPSSERNDQHHRKAVIEYGNFVLVSIDTAKKEFH